MTEASDAWRAYVVSGIGFLGGGVILNGSLGARVFGIHRCHDFPGNGCNTRFEREPDYDYVEYGAGRECSF